MSAVVATVVEWDALGRVAVAALVAGVGVTLCFSLAIAGATRFADMRRDQRPIEAAFYAALGLIGLAASLTAIVFAIVVMTSKS